MTENNLSTFETELKPLENEVLTLKEQANSLVVESDEDYAKANDLASLVNEKGKAIDKMRKFFVEPIKNHAKSIDGLFMPKVKEADEVVRIIKDKMTVYFDKKETARLAEERRLQAIRDAANKKREEAGKEVIAEPVREVAEVKKLNESENSKSTVKKKWVGEIISINELPDEIKRSIFAEAFKKGIIDSVVQKFIDAGMREISGVRVYEKSIINLLKK